MRLADIWKPVLRAIVGATLAFGAWFYFGIDQGYWLVISVLIALHLANSILIRKKMLFLISIGLIAASLSVLSGLLSQHILMLGMLLLMTTFVTVYLGSVFIVGWNAALALNCFAILSAGLPLTIESGIPRFTCIISGFMMAGLLQWLIFPSRLKQDLRDMFAACFNKLAALNTVIFACYLSKDYQEKHFYYEKKLHEKRRDILYSLNQARQLVSQSNEKSSQENLTLIEQLFEILLALNTLLYRVADHSTFEVAEKEFLAISINIDNNLKHFASVLIDKKILPNSSVSFVEDIQELAEVNHNALRVVASDPVVFLLFINDLENLNLLFVEISARLGSQ